MSLKPRATDRDLRRRRNLPLLAPLLILFTACQSAGDATLPTPPTNLSNVYAPKLLPQPSILGVTDGLRPGEVVLQFGDGASPQQARMIGLHYGLELSGGPLLSGPLQTGRYVFQTPKPVIQAETPTSAIVYFPDIIRGADRRAFLGDNHLRVTRWLRPIDGYALALVQLPPADLHPQLIDPVQGEFRITLPASLTQQSVLEWAAAKGLRLIDYAPDTGIALVHPESWQPPLQAPIREWSPPNPPPPQPTKAALYVQFATTMTADAISSIAQGLSLGVVGITPGDLATLTDDPARVKADIQLLSDMAQVQCVSTSPAPCPQPGHSSSVNSTAPLLQQVAQPSTMSAHVADGVLQLDWGVASGATAYAIFQSQSRDGPYGLLALVAGQQHTAFQTFDVAPPGASVYFQVLALHPCTKPSESTACDASAVIFAGAIGTSASWSNALSTPATADAASTTRSATEQPQPPLQTRPSPAPLVAATAVSASAADGHVVLGWAPVAGAAFYRVYRSTGDGPALYIAQTSELSFTDAGGTAGVSYGYQVAAVAASGLVGLLSPAVRATWAAATSTPSVIRALPAEAGALAGLVRFQVDSTSGSGRGSVEWRLSGPAAAFTIGSAPGDPNAEAPLSWSAALNWDTSDVPDGTYAVTATVIDGGGPQVSITTHYRIQNGAPPAPTSLSAIAQPGGVALTWQQPASETAATYRLFRDQPISSSPLAEMSADRRTYVDEHATLGQHVYQLVLVDAAGHGSVAAGATITLASSGPGTTPSGLDVKLSLPNGQELTAGGRVTDRVLVTAPAVEGLKLQLSSDGVTWKDIGQPPTCGETCALDFDLTSFVAGPYLIRAVTANQTSNGHGFIRLDAVRYSAPGGLTAAAGPLGVQLSWLPPSSALPSYYEIERRESGREWKVLDRVSAATYIDSRAPTGVELRYRIKAVDPEGTTGQASSEASVSLPTAEWAEHQAMPQPAAPLGLQASSSHGRATLRWAHVEGSNGYVVERRSEAEGPFAVVAITGDETFTESPALRGGEYSYRVVALNGPVAGPASAPASTLVVPSAPPLPIVPPTSGQPNTPPVPLTVKATTQNGEVHLAWSAAPDAAASTAYIVYRMNPQTGLFTVAGSNLETPSFVDSALSPGAQYGYVVTSSAPTGHESAFSSPAWVSLPPGAPVLKVDLVEPKASFVEAKNILALAQVTGAVDMAGISFAVSSGGGAWRSIPGGPIDPGAPSSPRPVLAAGGAALWGASLNTTSLSPGSYQFRVTVRDRAGNSQEQTENLLIVGVGSRGPPSGGLSASPTSGGVHLLWTSPAGPYTIQRSLFGADGPFESIATTQLQEYDDRDAIPGRAYSYRVVAQGADPTISAVDSATAQTASSVNPLLRLGAVSQSQLSVTVVPSTRGHQLDGGLHPLGETYDINATSLATGGRVHHLAEPAQLTFELPPAGSIDTTNSAIFHWDETTGHWLKEPSLLDSNSTSLTATVDHLSDFVLGATSQPSSSGGIAQPPAPPTDFRGPALSADPTFRAMPLPVQDFGPPGPEVVSARTASSFVYRNPDGTLRQVISSGLVNYQDANGVWQKIDTTLLPAGGTSTDVRNSAGPVQVQLPNDLSISSVQVSSASATLSFVLEGAQSTSRLISGNRASYAGVKSGIDAIYTTIPEGLKENLVIKTKLAQAPVFTFDITTGASLVLQRLPGGAVQAVDGSGHVTFTIQPPFMHDAPITQSELGNTTDSVAVSLSGGSGSYRLTYTPDASWLNDPTRLYPVIVDPTLTYNVGSGGESDAQFNECFPTSNYNTYTYLPIGYTPYTSPSVCNGKSRAMITFTAPMNPTLVSSAQLSLWQYTNYRLGGKVIQAVPAAAGWSASTVNWNNAPGGTCTYSCPSATTLNGTGWVNWDVTVPVNAWRQQAFAYNGFEMVGDESGCCTQEQFFGGPNADATTRPQLTLTFAGEESGTIAWQRAPQVITALAGSLISIPITVTNTTGLIGGTSTWHAFDHSDLVRVGIRDYRTTAGAIVPISNQPNLRTYLPADVANVGSANLNAVIQVPGDPGDYLLRLDLVHEVTGSAPIWFAGRGNQPLEVRTRIVAPGDDKTTHVPVALGDGSSFGINTSNGFATLSAADISIAERAAASLHLSRTYNGAVGLLSATGITGTGVTSSTYGLGWTFDFQRSLHLGSLGPNTYDPSSGILTDGQGRAWTLTWSAGRGLYEDAAGNRTVTPATAQVVAAASTLSVPVRPVDLINGSGAIVADAAAPGGYALRLEGTSGPPTMLIMPAGLVPTQQNGTIEFWFKPNFDMSVDTACHVFFSDSQLRFGLAWNCSSVSYSWGSSISRAIDFFTYDGDTSSYSILSSAAVTWASGSWHHITITWAEGGVKQLMTDTTLSASGNHFQSPISDLVFGYQPAINNGGLNYLNGRITQLRVDGRVVPGTGTSGELSQDAGSGATLNATTNTLYLGHYDLGSAGSSAGTYLLRNPDQSTESYSSYGLLQNEADRFGNQIDYSYDSSGRIQTISDHSIAGRTITFTYNSNSFVAADLGGRTITYQLNASGDLISVTRSNQVPNPLTGIATAQNTLTNYSYAAGHLLQQVTDPLGAKTTINYDQSYRQVVLIDNPTAYWRLGETSGTVAADAAGTHAGTLHGTVTLSQGGATWSDPDYSEKFDGSSGYISVSIASIAAGAPYTVEAWLKQASSSGSQVAVAFNQGVGSGMLWLNAGIPTFRVGTVSSFTDVAASAAIPAGWHHVAATYDGAYARLYVDGQLAAGPTAISSGSISTSLWIAAQSGTGNFFNGNLDEVALYTQTLSNARVQAHFVAGRLGVGANPVAYAANVVFDSPSAYWRLGDSVGTQAVDQSTGSNAAAYSGGATLAQSGALTTDSGTSVLLDGTGSISVTDNAALYGSAQLTAEAWVKATAWTGGASILNRRTAGNVGGFTLEVANTSGQINFSVYVGATWYSATTPKSLTVGVWHHLAGTYDGANLRLYADGILAASTAASGSMNNPAAPAFLIGKSVIAATYFNGAIQEAAVYPAALTPARVLTHYNVGRASPLGRSQYAGAVVGDLPVGYWRLGETSGTSAADSSASAYNGTYVGAISLGQGGGIANDSDHAVRFDGATAYVSLGNPAALQMSSGTLEAWVNTTTTSQSAIVAKSNAWWLGVQANGKLGFYDFTSATMRDSGLIVNDGYWHQVAAVFQSGVSSGSQMYVDGTAVGAPFLMTVLNQSSEAEISANAATQFFNGTIDETAIYGSAVAAARIAAHYQAARLVVSASGWTAGTYPAVVGSDRPVGYWRLGEASGSTAVTDRSGNNNSGATGGAGVTLGQQGALLTDTDTAARFDGSTTAYVSVPYSSLDNPAGTFSLELWVEVTGGQGTWRAVVSTACTTCSGYTGFELYARADNTWGAYIGTGATSWGYVIGGSVVLNQWTHVVETYNGSVLSLYVNGALIGTTTSAFGSNSSLPLYLGTDVTGGSRAYFLTGILDEVAVYPFALTRARIQAHYNAAWDFSVRRVATLQDARSTTVASLAYNDDTAVTQVIDGRGLPSYYTFQQYGGRTMSVTDTGNNVTRYEFDSGSAYILIATVSPAGIRRSRLVNSGALVGQQGQALIQDNSLQPSTTHPVLMAGGYPDPATYGSISLFTSGESWIWDSSVAVQPGVSSHRSTPVAGQHDHDIEFSRGIPIPYETRLNQWVFIEAGAKAPSELALQFYDGSGWAHRAYWGYNAGVVWGTGCPANCPQGSPVPVPMPVAGRWVLLTVDLATVDMNNRVLGGIAFTLFDGTGAVWWGPTTLDAPAASISDPLRTISRYTYNATNDVVAAVDPNGIASVGDIDSGGLIRVASTGVEPAAPIALLQDSVNALGTTQCPSIPPFPTTSWTQEYCNVGISWGTSTTQHGVSGSLFQTHTGIGLQSDLYRDVTGMIPGTYVRASVWVQTSAGAIGNGGALLIVENKMPTGYNTQRRSASVQTTGQWAQLTLPLIIDNSGQLRVHLWQENLQGATIWADLHIDDLTPAPDVTLQHPLALYSYGFEVMGDTSWTLGSTPATILQDSSQAHGGQYSVRDRLNTYNTSNTVSRTVSLTGVNATYRVTAWARTVVSGSSGGGGGAQLCVASPGVNCTSAIATEGQWQLLQEVVGTGGFSSLIVQLVHANFQGDVYWDDVYVERLADASPAGTGLWQGTNWTGTYTSPAVATWASSWSGGIGGAPSRQVTITTTSALTDIRDALPMTVLRTGASYVISMWASSSVANTTIDFSLRDSNFNSWTMDQTTSCLLQTTPTLCQNSLTYPSTATDRGTNNLVIYYGGQGARTVSISHPLVALQATRTDYTSAAMPNHVFDVFGHSTTTTYDSTGLYPTQAVVTATPSPNLTTNFTYNPLGQLILNTRVNGGQSIAQQLWLDSWGRQVGVVRNCVTALAPPNLCNAAANSSTNVLTRFAYDLDGNLTDRYDQAQVSGSWINTHYQYDADNNQVARIQNCVTLSNPCDASSSAAQNVVTAFAYDAVNHLVDTYSPMPGCASSCAPTPTCTAGPPPICMSPATPCPASTCVDDHMVYDTASRPTQQIANYGGSQDVSQANVTGQVAYDGDGRVTDIFAPITNATLQTGQIVEHKIYDVLGRLVTDIKANTIPSWMAATTQARTDYTLDIGGRVVSVTGPGTGSTSQTNRIVTTTDYDDLGRPLNFTADSGTGHLNAISRTVYDPRGAVHRWTPPTQQLSTGIQTSTNYDLAGHVTSVVRDDGTGGLHLTTTTNYDGYGRPIDVIDPRGIDTNTVYDALDRVSTVTQNYCPSFSTNPNCSGSGVLPDQNLTTSYLFDLAGNRTQVVNPRSIVQFSVYDPLHRTTSVTQSCQNVPTPPSTSCGTQSSDQNVLRSQAFDQAGDVLTTTDPLSRVNLVAYDALGRKTSETINCVGTGGLCNGGVTSGQNLTTLWQVDAQGNVLKETSPRQCTATAPCNNNGTTITDGANLTTGYIYDGLLRLVSVIEDQGHLGPPTTYSYDPSGNRLSQTDGNGVGHITTYTIDNLSRTTKVTDANSYIVQTNYSLAGEVISTVNARAKTNGNTLDRLSRLVGVSYFKADGITALSRSFGYDADSNKTSFSDTDVAQTTVTYDHLNRPSTVTAPSPFGTTTYTYFLDGAVNTIADANGTTTFTEDRLGRTATMIDPLTTGTTGYTYDASARLSGRTEANGIVTTVTYTGADQLASKTEVAGSTTLATWTNLTYDLAQNRTAETLGYYAGNPYPDAQAGTATYQYDTQNQLSQAALPGRSAGTYGYDGAHNLTANAGTTQTYSSNESLQTFAAATTGSDADGNQLKDVNGATLSWNSLSQLEQFSTSETYAYDAIGRLTIVANGANVTKFAYQGLSAQVVQELNASNAVVRSYVWDTLGRQLYVKSGGNVYYEITNPHGDGVALASPTALVGTQHFDPWGNSTYAPSGTTTPFGFQGAFGSWMDGTTGFVSMGVRWYYPKVARFLSSDPAAGTADPRSPIHGMRWIYGANDPLVHDDPSGLANIADGGGGCDEPCPTAGADARENNQHALAQGTARATYSAPAQVLYHGSDRHGAPHAGGDCNIGSQSCGTFAQHFGTQLLKIACGLTICPAIQGAKETYKLISDPSGFWKDQTDQWNAEEAWLGDVFNTYEKATDAHVGGVPIGWIPGVPQALFAMKWTADRLQDFNNDPGTASANIFVFFESLAVPGPKVLSGDASVTIRVRPSIDTAQFKPREATANGGIRDHRQFWKKWLEEYPETLDVDNKARIRDGRVPKVNETWTSVYPEDSPYMGDLLEHHHIDQGRYATPIPRTLHQRANMDLHSRRGGAQAV